MSENHKLLPLSIKTPFQSSRKIFFVNTGVNLPVQLEILCQYLQVDGTVNVDLTSQEIHRLMQFIWKNAIECWRYLVGYRLLTRQEVTKLSSVEIREPEAALLVLRVELQVQAALASIQGTNENVKKKSLYDIRTKLSSIPWARSFLKQGGVKTLSDVMRASQGTTLAYALRALDTVLSYGHGFDSLNQVKSCIFLC